MKLKNILQIKSLEYEVDNQKIIKGNSFNINYKEHQLILGNSGSGKTTLLNLMSGLLKPSGGEILFKGVKYSTLNEKDLDSLRAENFGFIFQKLNLIEYLSVKQNIALVNDNSNSLCCASSFITIPFCFSCLVVSFVIKLLNFVFHFFI